MSNLNNEDFNAIKEAGFINEWKKPGSDEVRYYINTKEIMNLWSEDKIKLGYSRRERSELEAHKWWYVESKKGGFVLKTSIQVAPMFNFKGNPNVISVFILTPLLTA